MRKRLHSLISGIQSRLQPEQVVQLSMCKVALARMSNRTSSDINTNPSTKEIETYLLCNAYGLAEQSALLDERYRVVSA